MSKYYYPAETRIIHRNREIMVPAGGMAHRAPERYCILPGGEKKTADQVRSEDLTASGLYPYREETVATGYRATGWALAVEDGVMWRRPTGVEAAQTVDELREELLQANDNQQYALLLPTDCYYTRLAETGEAVPDDVLTARAAIRAAHSANEAELAAITDYDAMLAYQPTWGDEE